MTFDSQFYIVSNLAKYNYFLSQMSIPLQSSQVEVFIPKLCFSKKLQERL